MSVKVTATATEIVTSTATVTVTATVIVKVTVTATDHSKSNWNINNISDSEYNHAVASHSKSARSRRYKRTVSIAIINNSKCLNHDSRSDRHVIKNDHNKIRIMMFEKVRDVLAKMMTIMGITVMTMPTRATKKAIEKTWEAMIEVYDKNINDDRHDISKRDSDNDLNVRNEILDHFILLVVTILQYTHQTSIRKAIIDSHNHALFITITMSKEVLKMIAKDSSRAKDKRMTVLKATTIGISTMILEVVVFKIVKSRKSLETIKKNSRTSMIKVVPMIYSKIAIFRKKKKNDYSNEDSYGDLDIDDNDTKNNDFFFNQIERWFIEFQFRWLFQITCSHHSDQYRSESHVLFLKI